MPSGFFDAYPRFLETSRTNSFPNRLNERYRACIEWNEIIIRGRRVLDIASHDSRWSFAALKAGASSLTGIEARDHLVQSANDNLRRYGITRGFQFILGDVFEELGRIKPESVDTVFCFGFFYHVAHHMLLLSRIANLKPKYLILDTMVYQDPLNAILLKGENPENEGGIANVGVHHSADAAHRRIVTGTPSRTALEFMLSSFGWSFVYYGWQNANIERWDNILDYQTGDRVTLRVKCS